MVEGLLNWTRTVKWPWLYLDCLNFIFIIFKKLQNLFDFIEYLCKLLYNLKYILIFKNRLQEDRIQPPQGKRVRLTLLLLKEGFMSYPLSHLPFPKDTLAPKEAPELLPASFQRASPVTSHPLGPVPRVLGWEPEPVGHRVIFPEGPIDVRLSRASPGKLGHLALTSYLSVQSLQCSTPPSFPTSQFVFLFQSIQWTVQWKIHLIRCVGI